MRAQPAAVVVLTNMRACYGVTRLQLSSANYIRSRACPTVTCPMADEKGGADLPLGNVKRVVVRQLASCLIPLTLAAEAEACRAVGRRREARGVGAEGGAAGAGRGGQDFHPLPDGDRQRSLPRVQAAHHQRQRRPASPGRSGLPRVRPAAQGGASRCALLVLTAFPPRSLHRPAYKAANAAAAAQKTETKKRKAAEAADAAGAGTEKEASGPAEEA